MKVIPNVTFCLSLRGAVPVPLEPEDDGYIGMFKQGDGTTIDVVASIRPSTDGSRILCLVVEERPGRKKEVTLLEPYVPVDDSGTSEYAMGVPVRYSPTNICHVTMIKENHFYLLETGKDGNFVLWQVAVVSQMGRFFFSVLDKYRGRMYAGRGITFSPEMQGWPEMSAVLVDVYRNQVGLDGLPDARQAAVPAEPVTGKLGKGEAEILFFDIAKGFGGLRTDDKSARFFVTEVTPRPGERLISLTTGDRVAVSELRRNTKAQPGQFQFDALGVQAL